MALDRRHTRPQPRARSEGPSAAQPVAASGPVRDDPAAPDTGALIDLKAVPGASRDEIAGLLGTRLKIRISAPPEGGKANAAICALLARALGVPARSVDIVSGHAQALKTARVKGVAAGAVRAHLGLTS
ncbi:MAG: DUF167 domain-containing protein [Phycisphaerales bacterium]